jgi:Zn-dependent M28 family amino/carboxypeptidase
VTGGVARGEALSADYTTKRYHQPDDEWSPTWDLTGLAQDAALLHMLGRRLANSREWPTWSDDSEFRSVRDKSEGDRAGAPHPAKPGERG